MSSKQFCWLLFSRKLCYLICCWGNHFCKRYRRNFPCIFFWQYYSIQTTSSEYMLLMHNILTKRQNGSNSNGLTRSSGKVVSPIWMEVDFSCISMTQFVDGEVLCFIIAWSTVKLCGFRDDSVVFESVDEAKLFDECCWCCCIDAEGEAVNNSKNLSQSWVRTILTP